MRFRWRAVAKKVVIADLLDNGEQIPSQCSQLPREHASPMVIENRVVTRQAFWSPPRFELKKEKALLFFQKGFNFFWERYRDEAVSRPAIEIVVRLDAPKMNV